MALIDTLNYAPSARSASDWQAALLKHLVTFDALCREHDIAYSLAFGGLLGAVRHRGFIPWDNDVDVVMTEGEYKKLLAVVQDGGLPSGYAFVDRNTEEDYPLLFGRFVNTETSCPLSTSAFNGGTHGVFIDVFILFPLPDDPDQQEEAHMRFLVWEQLACWVKRRSKYRTQDFCDLWCQMMDYEASHGHEAALRKAEADFRALIPEFGSSTWCFHGSGGKYNGFPRFKCEWFAHPEYIPFENVELAAPNGRMEFLDRFYGAGWRRFLPGEHFTAYSCGSLNVPGDVVSEDYMQLIDQKQAVEDFKDYTSAHMEETVVMRRSNIPPIRAKIALSAERINQRLDSSPWVGAFSGTGLESVPVSEAAQALKDFEDIYKLLDNKDVTHWHLRVPLEPAVFMAAMGARFLAGYDFWSVQRMMRSIDADELSSGPCRRELSRLAEALEACTELYRAIDVGAHETVRECLDMLVARCPQSVHAHVAQAYLLAGEPARCKDYIGDLAAAERSNDYLRLFHAGALLATGTRDAAVDELRTLAKTTDNGMVLLAVRDLCQREGIAGIATKAVSKALPEEEDENVLPGLRHFGLASVQAFSDFGLGEARRHQRELKSIRRRLGVLAERIGGYRALRRLTSERLYTWERIYPRREYVKEAFARGDVDALSKLLKAYLNSAYLLYDELGLGLFIDQLTLDAALPVFLRDRGGAFAKDFIARIPEPHKCEDFDVMLKRKGVAHPYFAEGWTPGSVADAL